MYSRNVDGQTRSFGVSGKLWHGVLVMYDRETESLWTQLDGRAIQGTEHGQRLEHVPSVFTTWEAWLSAHPQTLVLEKDEEARGLEESRYAGYFDDPERLFQPTLAEGLGDVLEPKETVFGIQRNGDALAVPESLMVKQRIVNTTVGAEPVALLRDDVTGGVRGVLRLHEGRVLELALSEDALLLDGSGREIDAADLAPLRVDRAFWYAWKRSHQDTRILTE